MVNDIDILKSLFAFILAIGIVGNTLNIIIYSKSKLRKSLTFRFFLCLSITDFVILLLCAIETSIEYNFNFDLRSSFLISCKFGTFFAYALTQTRNLLSMAITIQSKKFLFFSIYSLLIN